MSPHPSSLPWRQGRTIELGGRGYKFGGDRQRPRPVKITSPALLRTLPTSSQTIQYEKKKVTRAGAQERHQRGWAACPDLEAACQGQRSPIQDPWRKERAVAVAPKCANPHPGTQPRPLSAPSTHVWVAVCRGSPLVVGLGGEGLSIGVRVRRTPGCD